MNSSIPNPAPNDGAPGQSNQPDNQQLSSETDHHDTVRLRIKPAEPEKVDKIIISGDDKNSTSTLRMRIVPTHRPASAKPVGSPPDVNPPSSPGTLRVKHAPQPSDAPTPTANSAPAPEEETVRKKIEPPTLSTASQRIEPPTLPNSSQRTEPPTLSTSSQRIKPPVPRKQDEPPVFINSPVYEEEEEEPDDDPHVPALDDLLAKHATGEWHHADVHAQDPPAKFIDDYADALPEPEPKPVAEPVIKRKPTHSVADLRKQSEANNRTLKFFLFGLCGIVLLCFSAMGMLYAMYGNDTKPAPVAPQPQPTSPPPQPAASQPKPAPAPPVPVAAPQNTVEPGLYLTDEKGKPILPLADNMTINLAIHGKTQVRAFLKGDADTVQFVLDGRAYKDVTPPYALSDKVWPPKPGHRKLSVIARFKGSATMTTWQYRLNILDGRGVVICYYGTRKSSSRVVNKTAETISFDWGSTSPAKGIEGDSFQAQFCSFLVPKLHGRYKLYLKADDDAVLRLDGKQILATMGNKQEVSKTMDLQANRSYRLDIDYAEDSGEAHLVLKWKGPGFEKTIVPAEVLFLAE